MTKVKNAAKFRDEVYSKPFGTAGTVFGLDKN